MRWKQAMYLGIYLQCLVFGTAVLEGEGKTNLDLVLLTCCVDHI